MELNAYIGIHASIDIYAYIGKMTIIGINDMPI